MARTEGSGWGDGMIRLYQVCPFCKNKKVIYHWRRGLEAMRFRCTACKEVFDSNDLLKVKYAGKQNDSK